MGGWLLGWAMATSRLDCSTASEAFPLGDEKKRREEKRREEMRWEKKRKKEKRRAEGGNGVLEDSEVNVNWQYNTTEYNWIKYEKTKYNTIR